MVPAKPLPTLPDTIPSWTRQLCYAIRKLPRGYARLLLRLARMQPSLQNLTIELEDVGSFAIDLRESVCVPLFVHGCYTNQLLQDQVLDQLLSPGMTVFDLGANIGYYTKFFSRRVAPGAVLSVEPMPRALSLLKRNADQNVTVLPVAVGPSPGSAAIQEMAKLNISFVRFETEGPRNVGTVTIDSLSEQYGCPDFIKIDIEGAELAAFHGASNTLGSLDPPTILFEYIPENASNFGSYQLTDLLRRLSPAYEVFRIDRPGKAANALPAANDYLAVPLRKTPGVLSKVQEFLYPVTMPFATRATA